MKRVRKNNIHILITRPNFDRWIKFFKKSYNEQLSVRKFESCLKNKAYTYHYRILIKLYKYLSNLKIWFLNFKCTFSGILYVLSDGIGAKGIRVEIDIPFIFPGIFICSSSLYMAFHKIGPRTDPCRTHFATARRSVSSYSSDLLLR